MTYSISQAAEKTGLSIHTIRYYDKEGLLPFIDRRNGTRIFSEQDIDWIDLICCLKQTRMPIKDLRSLIQHCTDNDAVLEKGMEILLKHREMVESQLVELQNSLKTINYKIKHLPRMYQERFAKELPLQK
ncbi:MerR family transcriptional regulator [Paenibacillus sp. MY03]|jgi:DNA-binding transcriptional MerR regulator|uniref:MerR family transcriptional regulator n=1 Tax=Paenibacillus agaridevorans TaxID=171404 RepID=A0A2R5F1K9_9BACL|nr:MULTISPECIES: MerR family transcriptional regulator [Paenibacillus]OUS73692.1 MerR family transcriptional regulator [Paenibacillus sp. MY03]GBG12365.1 MerR family transcriptional regulator [Paenibacillus agaridevorans]